MGYIARYLISLLLYGNTPVWKCERLLSMVTGLHHGNKFVAMVLFGAMVLTTNLYSSVQVAVLYCSSNLINNTMD